MVVRDFPELRLVALAILASQALVPVTVRAETSDADTPLRPGQPQVALSALLLAPQSRFDTGPAVLTIGRGQDIVGNPVDFSRMPKPSAPVGQLRGLRQLPTTATMPTRLPLIGAFLTSRYGMRWHPIKGGYRAHRGIDLAAPAGSPIYAPAAGMVSGVGWDGGYGISVIIEHGGGLQTRYGHMSKYVVAPGQMVAAGTVIGYVGSTGLSTGPHLHYEIRSNGQTIDPLSGSR
jgi:murein DD-endopeptidase MepM/ murein hydrolase activator NlpD